MNYYEYEKLIRQYRRRQQIWGLFGCFGFLVFIGSLFFSWNLGAKWFNEFGFYGILMAFGVQILIWIALIITSWTLDAFFPNPRVDR